jgi:glycosyltransferase involved in cell wall biosynthesis
MSDGLACVVLSLRDQPGLVDAVRSLIGQSERAEIVVVNSGGGDSTATLRDAGLHVPVIELPRRLFPGAARNLGIHATHARYVAFLSADSRAYHGWVAGRLREHRSGAAAVAGVLTNASPGSRSASAAALLLHHRLMPDTPPRRRLFYGLSYDRALFDRHGGFREDLRGGEDTEFNARISQCTSITWTADVRSAHRNPTRPDALLRDLFARGRRQAAMRGRLKGRPGSSQMALRVAVSALTNVPKCLRQLARTTDPGERRALARAWPLLIPGAVAYAAGAIAEGWAPRHR